MSLQAEHRVFLGQPRPAMKLCHRADSLIAGLCPEIIPLYPLKCSSVIVQVLLAALQKSSSAHL